MNKTKKLIALVLALVLVCAGSVFATVAYLTAQKTVTNTFTVGNIDITLKETKVDVNGNPVDENGDGKFDKTIVGNEYHLIPGSSYVKDPTVGIKEASEESYVRMLVEVTKLDELKAALPQDKHPEYYGTDDVFLLQALVEGWDNSVWAFEKVDGNVYEFRYHTTVKGAADDNDGVEDYTNLEPLFTHIKLPGVGLDNADMQSLKDLKINVTAQAIQAANFADADAAWAAFDEQNAGAQDPNA